MDLHSVNSETIKRLQQRALKENCSVDELVSRLLALDPLYEAETLYNLLIENSSDSVILFDLDLRYLRISPIIEKLLNVPVDEIIGKTNAEMGMSQEEIDFWQEAWAVVRETGQEQIRNYQLMTLKGLRHFEARLTPVFDSAGQLRYMLSINRDVTEREVALEALRHSEERYRLLTEIMSDYALSVRVNEDGRRTVEWVVGAFEEITGHSRDIYQNHPSLSLIHPDDVDMVVSDMDLTVQGQPTVTEYRVFNKAGHYIWLRVSRMPIFDESQGRVVRFYSAGKDITERKMAETALRQSEERYRIVSELISDYAFSYLVDEHGEISLDWTTDSYTHLTGYLSYETDQDDGFLLYHPEDRDKARQDVQAVIKGREVTGVYRILTRGGQLSWLRIYRRPIFNETGRVIRFYGVAQDITAAHKAEVIALEQQRLKANLKKEKEFNSLVQRMISSLSHDIRTPLTVIGTVKEILMHYNHKLSEEERHRQLSTIDKQLRYVLEMLDDLSDLMQNDYMNQSIQFSEVNVAALCQLSIEEIRTVNPQALRIHFINHDNIHSINGDETLISRILLNLLSNAVKFSPQDGQIWLELGRSPNGFSLSVRDEGIGISEEDQAHIFEPFYRASDVQEIKGTGLGLSIVSECVRRYGGRISLESQRGQGTTFIVELPFNPKAPA